jgi:abortive infection bacteriophage resistance protein
MANMRYTKPPLTIDQQIELLRSRGMQIPEPQKAAAALATLGYYRLSAYWLSFEEQNLQGIRTHKFKAGTTFEKSLALYKFDVQLRQLCFAGVKQLELAVRTQFGWTKIFCFLPNKSSTIIYSLCRFVVCYRTARFVKTCNLRVSL